jgi:hypothetical protein
MNRSNPLSRPLPQPRNKAISDPSASHLGAYAKDATEGAASAAYEAGMNVEGVVSRELKEMASWQWQFIQVLD